MVISRLSLFIVAAAFVMLAPVSAVADPGDPIEGFGDNGVVEIPPEHDLAVAPGELLVTPQGVAVIDVGDGDIDVAFSGVSVGRDGEWVRLEYPGACSATRAVLADDGSYFFAGDCEAGSFVIRYAPDLTLDTEWGDPSSPGVFWGPELGSDTVLAVSGDEVVYMVGPYDDRQLVGRRFDGTLVGTLAIDRTTGAKLALSPLGVVVGSGGEFGVTGFLEDGDLGVVRGSLGGDPVTSATFPISGQVVTPAAAERLSNGDLAVAYVVQDVGLEVHLAEVARDGGSIRALAPSLVPAGVGPSLASLALAELRTGDIVVLASGSTGHTEVHRFVPGQQGYVVLVGESAFPGTPLQFADVAVSPFDGHVLVSGGVATSTGSVFRMWRFEGDESGRFIDDDASIFQQDIEWLYDNGITRGCNPTRNDRFCPNEPVSRGQLAALLVRTFGYVDAGPGDLFVDDDGSLFEADIDKLAAAGVTKGCNPPHNDEYCPDAAVTRGQVAAFLVRALGLTATGTVDFVDDDGSVFEADIEKLAAAGITKGCNPPLDDHYCPDAPVTRGELAALLHRALG